MDIRVADGYTRVDEMDGTGSTQLYPGGASRM